MIETETKEHPIYMCTAPFGILFNKLSGGGGGDWAFFSFGISNRLQEDYIIKYLDEDQLKTYKVSTESAKIVIDGKFILEEKLDTYYWERGWGRNKHWEVMDRRTRRTIHLPSLPEPDFKMTTNFIHLGNQSLESNVRNEDA